MIQAQETRLKTEYDIQWEKLPDDFKLPDDPVENIHHPLLASALREMLDLAGFINPDMLIGSNFGICATVNGKIVIKAPDWFYVPSVLPIPVGMIRRSYTPHTEGEVPAVVMEFLSDTEQGEYSSKSTYPYGKWYFYERILQVPVYVIFDSPEGTLEVHFLSTGHYELQQPDANQRYWIESMGLFLGVWHGTKSQVTGYWLRWWDASGQMLLWGEERVQQSLQQGIQQGLQQGKLDLILRLLTRRFGTTDAQYQARINNLSAADLDELSEALLDCSDVSALSNWLDGRQV
jgi:Uma2 family endonuclease